MSAIAAFSAVAGSGPHAAAIFTPSSLPAYTASAAIMLPVAAAAATARRVVSKLGCAIGMDAPSGIGHGNGSRRYSAAYSSNVLPLLSITRLAHLPRRRLAPSLPASPIARLGR